MKTRELCYLDDCTLGGEVHTVAEDVQRVLDFEAKSGLQLNPMRGMYTQWGELRRTADTA